MSPNNLPGPGDLPVPDPEPEIPDWALEQAEEELLTNDFLWNFVSQERIMDLLHNQYDGEIRRRALEIIDRMNDKSL